ncbi:MAG TPA: hypothetical protein VJ905_06425 [Halalkalibaculum sp.]|nr:hypothetical protein [Halalkalibaculum sp.]
MSRIKRVAISLLTGLVFIVIGCSLDAEQKPRLSLFVGVDISGSFINSGYFDESLNFLAHYIYAHLESIDDLEEPNVLFVSSIGGAQPDEPKTFFPIQTFENKSVEEIEERLHDIFPDTVQNPITDFNAFFEQVALTLRNKNLVLRPVSVVMVSDGIPDIKKDGETDFRSLDLSPLEQLSRNITIRVLYTDPVTGRNWQTKVPRRRVKIWTQDAEVMTTWNDSTIYLHDKPIVEQARWTEWVKDNVNFGVRARRVD